MRLNSGDGHNWGGPTLENAAYEFGMLGAVRYGSCPSHPHRAENERARANSDRFAWRHQALRPGVDVLERDPAQLPDAWFHLSGRSNQGYRRDSIACRVANRGGDRIAGASQTNVRSDAGAGATGAMRANIGAARPVYDQRLLDGWLESARVELGEAAWQSNWSVGEATDFDAAVAQVAPHILERL